MLVRRGAALVLIMALLGSVVFSQTTDADKAERAKKAKEVEEQITTILDRTIADIGALRLAQNRAVVYALAGDIYWRYDSKRSRELFRTGAGELVVYQGDAEKERLENIGQGIPDIYDPNDPRFEFLNLVGSRDPELGLELMQSTRPPAIAEAMARIAQQAAAAAAAPPGTVTGTMANGGSAGYEPDRIKAQQEISLEQSLTMRAAANDPDKAAKAIKDSLAKGISLNVVGLLQQILQKDEKRTGELASDVIAKITSTDLTRSNDDLNGAMSFLQYVARPAAPPNPAVKFKIFSFSDSQAREVAQKLANTMLQPSPPAFVNNAISRALPSIEKLAPEKAILLKQKDAQNKKAAATAAPKPAQPRPFNPEDTPEAIIAAAGKITNPRDKTSAYQTAANKIGQIADEARARKIIDSIPDERIRAEAQNRFDANRINRLTIDGRLDEAKASVAALTNRHTQIQRLVALAIQFQQKKTDKDKETATAIMTEAKSLAQPFPEDEDELSDYMELIRGYALVEPDVAFRMIEPMMDQFNEMIQASAVLTRFNKRDRTFKKGELVMRINGGVGNGMLAFRYIPQIQSLARADLDRMSLLADRFQRADARTLMKLYVLQGYQRIASVGPGFTSF